MSEERTKILEMVRDGIITIEEGEELLRVLEESRSKEKKDSKFKKAIKEDLHKTKEELLKAKARLVAEYEKFDKEKLKSAIKKGIEKIDNAVGKVDEAILNYGSKMMNKKSKEKEEAVSETLDPTVDDNITFIDKDK
jgi:hypothetical protein